MTSLAFSNEDKKQQISKNIRYQKIDIDFVLHKDDKASTRMRQAKCRHP